MFGIGPQELLVILVVGLLVLGPKRLPEIARSLGRGLAEFRRASSDLRQSLSLEDEPRRHAPPPRPPAPAVTPETPKSDDPAEGRSIASPEAAPATEPVAPKAAATASADDEK